MNNKEKYIAEVDSLRAGEELKNAILENAQIKPRKNVYKKIIPLAACLVIAVLVAVPGLVHRAGRAKNATQEVAYDAAVAENEIAAADNGVSEEADAEIAEEKAFVAEGKGTYSANSKTGSGEWYIDAINRGLTNIEKEAVLGHSYNSEGDYFYTDDKDCWQAGMSYNEVYDKAAGLPVMFADKARIRFDYDDKAYMIQLWKGQYGWVFVGGEIGVYTTDEFKTSEINQTDINHYQCADKSDWLNMSMDVFWDSDKNGTYEKLFSRPYTKYWWCTGFKFGTLNRFSSPITELIMKARITFKTATQASLFTSGMKRAGFRGASSSGSLSNDSIFQNGSDVYFRWYSVLTEWQKVDPSDPSNNNNNNNNNTNTTTVASNPGTSTTTAKQGSIFDLFTSPATPSTSATPTQTVTQPVTDHPVKED